MLNNFPKKIAVYFAFITTVSASLLSAQVLSSSSGNMSAALPPNASILRISETGAVAPKVTIVEFADFQCPFCARAASTLRNVLRAYPDNVRLIVKHVPLSIHPTAPLLHEAALAAGEQGKFWEMYYLLYERQGKLGITEVTALAQELGLDIKQFRSAVESERYKDIIQRDQEEARAFGVSGTPTFFINGRRISGNQSFDDFKKLIDYQITGKSNTTNAQPKTAVVGTADLNIANAPSRGAPQAAVTIVEFSDMQCPFCAREINALRQVLADNPGQVRWVFKHFPLSFHANSALAHEAIMAANTQGKFWEMHDAIFANQKAIARNDLDVYARQLNLDMAKFDADLDSSRYREQIQTDQQDGERLGVTGTPTLFINGQRFVGAQQAADLAKVIAKELAHSSPNAANSETEKLKARPEIALGPVSAPVTITWYDDLSSPLTRQADAVIRSLIQQYPNHVRVVFRNRPLSLYSGAEIVHEAAMAAAANNKFWEMEQLIAARRSPAQTFDLLGYASQLGFDKSLFAAALDSRMYRPTVEADLLEAKQLDVRGSPTFFVNGTRVDGIPAGERLKELVDGEISRHQALLSQNSIRTVSVN